MAYYYLVKSHLIKHFKGQRYREVSVTCMHKRETGLAVAYVVPKVHITKGGS